MDKIIEIDDNWEELLSLNIIKKGDSLEGITFVTDGEKWGAMCLDNPIIPIKYDSICFLSKMNTDEDLHIVCEINNKYDIFDYYGNPEYVGLANYDGRDFRCHEKRFFICLANSYKRGGRCIAGVEIDSNNSILFNNNGNPKWIRPIETYTQYGEIPNNIACNIKLLSSVTLKHVVGYPQTVHRENVSYVEIEANPLPFHADSSFLNQFVDKVHQSIFGNRGKAVSVDMASRLDYSLMFIHVQNASAYIDEDRERSKNRMKFIYYGTEYEFPITDPMFLDSFKREPERFANIPDVYLTISLGLEFEGWHHKLIAGVIIPTDSLENENNENRTSQPKASDWFNEYEQELERLLDQKADIEEQINELRQKLLKQMESYGVEKIQSHQFSISYTPTKTVMQFDRKAFKTENEDLYFCYCKPKQREASIIVKRIKKE
ncbi:MAG: siphovirus Gp157 family protein [Bacteroidaceae bacterium]|nr:siphovirus Gp157 family protein [Bacteroidaceae bacterium]